MLTLEIEQTDVLTLVFSFDEEGVDFFLSRTNWLREKIDHEHFIPSLELDEFNDSRINFTICDILTIYHVSPDFMEHESETDVNVGDGGKSAAVDMAFNEAGINDFFDRVMALSKDNRIVEFGISHSNIIRDGRIESEDCVVTVRLQFADN